MKTVYYQLKDGVPIPFTGKYVRHAGRIVAPPTAAALAAIGYFPMASVTPPAFDGGKQTLSVTYRVEHGAILPQYTVVMKEEEA